MMEITNYISIYKHHAKIRNELFLKDEEELPFGKFIRKVYKRSEIKYPKFFKMDSLSKLAFVSSELLLKDHSLEEYDKTKVGVILQNSHSTIDTDRKYYETIKDKENYFPSPAVFVYTLPNVMIGEICIRNGIKGENTCFIEEQFNVEQIYHYIRILFENNRLDACITGWVDYFEENYRTHLFLVEKNKDIKEDSISFNVQNLKQLSNLL